MKTGLTFALLFIACFSCRSQEIETDNPDLYKKTFNELEQLLLREKSEFWNQELYGPIMLVDPNSRQIIANRNNFRKDLTKENGVFLGKLPEEINLANTAFNWEGERWTMVLLPLPEDRFEKNKLLIHELFHRIQPELGMTFNEVDNEHLDTYEGRLLLLLELEALKTALKTENRKTRKIHIRNALSFRELRQETKDVKESENSLEMNEGLAEYTGLMLSGESESEIKEQLIQSLDEFHETPTFVRSFAYRTIPAYGYLLSLDNQDWHKQITSQTNLTDFFGKSFSVDMGRDLSVEQIIANQDYNYTEISKKERIREKERLERIQEYKKKFLEGPTLDISFQEMNISFDPRNLVPLENHGTVYPHIRVTDNWGVLEVNQGALLSSDWSGIKVTAPTDITESLAKGQGWVLTLNEGWQLESHEGNFRLVNNK